MNDEVLKRILKKIEEFGIKELRDFQKQCLPYILEGRNLVIVAPTSSGKTLVAEIYALYTVLKHRKKCIYLVPLRAIAFEKYKSFCKRWGELARIAVTVGDYDSADPWLDKYDIIITTVEKFDSLIRHKAPWLPDVGLVVADEIHLLGESSRGPTLEMTLVKVRRNYNPRIVAMSATFPNAEELAEWLDAVLIKSDYRPVILHEMVYFNGTLENSKRYKLLGGSKDPEERIVEDTLARDKQVIFFVSSRRGAEKLAKKLCRITEKYVQKKGYYRFLYAAAEEILATMDSPTGQCKELAECVKKGCAFHHAGLKNEQRIIIEELFRKGYLPVLCATPTLAAGVNLPAYRVVIRDLKRYSPAGAVWIKVLEYKQMAGRAGRVGYEDEGEAISIARNLWEVDFIKQRYIYGQVERVISCLGSLPALRFHTLALISEEGETSTDYIMKIFEDTFFAHTFGNIDVIRDYIYEILKELKDWGFIHIEGSIIKATPVGRRISELYIDPLSGKLIIDLLKSGKINEFSVLYTIASCTELRPLPPVKAFEEDILYTDFLKHQNELYIHEEELDYLNRWKLVRILYAWISEEPEGKICEEFGIYPGDLLAYRENAEWLLYAAKEIERLTFRRKEVVKYLDILRRRMESGVKEELLELVSIPGIGRVRARKLYDSGIKSLEDIKKAPLPVLERILGPKIGRSVKEYVEGKIKEIPKEERGLLKWL